MRIAFDIAKMTGTGPTVPCGDAMLMTKTTKTA